MKAERMSSHWRKRLLAVSVAVGATLALSACSSIPNWAKPTTWYQDVVGDDNQPPTATVVPPAAEATPTPTYPNVGPVPPRPTPPSAASQAKIEKGLVAERTKAQYAAAALTGTPPNPPSGAATTPISPEPVLPGSVVKAPQPPPPAQTTNTTTATPTQPAAGPSPAAVQQSGPPPPQAPPQVPPQAPPQVQAQARGPVAPPMREAAAVPPRATPPQGGTYTSDPSAALVSTYISALSDSGSRGRSGTGPAGQRTAATGGTTAGSAGAAAPRHFAEAGIRHVATLYFPAGSVRITANEESVLREIAAKSKSLSAMIRVVGYASPRANGASLAQRKLANFNISYRRAEAVGRALVRAGATPDNVLIVAASDNSATPGVSATTPDDRPRVEIFLEN